MRNIPHVRQRVEHSPASTLNVTQHKTRFSKIHSFYFELLYLVYNSYHKKSLIHLAQKSQLPVYTSKFHPNSSAVERERNVQPAQKAVRTGTTQSIRQSRHGCDCTQVADDTINRAITVCLWFDMFTAMVATGDWSWPRALHIAVSAAAAALTGGGSVKLRYTQYPAQHFFPMDEWKRSSYKGNVQIWIYFSILIPSNS